MNRFPQALFRAGGVELIEGKPFTTKMVHDEDQLAEASADGFHETADDALADAEAKLAEAQKRDADAAGSESTKPPTREELELKAKELGIEFKAQTSNKKLAADIEAKLAEAQQ